MSEPLQNPPDWISVLAAAVAGLGTRHLLNLANLLDPSRPIPPSSGQVQRALSLSTALATQLARDLDRIVRFPGVSVQGIRTALLTLATTRNPGNAQSDSVEIACTAPARLGVPLRTTYATALEMVSKRTPPPFLMLACGAGY